MDVIHATFFTVSGLRLLVLRELSHNELGRYNIAQKTPKQKLQTTD